MKKSTLFYASGSILVAIIIGTAVLRSGNDPKAVEKENSGPPSLIGGAASSTLINTAAATQPIKVFFSNAKFDPGASCDKVFPVTRSILKTSAVGRASLLELLAGPTKAEKAQGFTTAINPGVPLKKLTIENSTAYADFSGKLEENAAGSCRVIAIRAQITETLKQFPSVKNVVISVNGRVADILQP